MTGAPRVAAFFADLDPFAGGTVFVRSAADAFTATWCGVRVFDSTRQVTVQTSLFPDGTIEMKYAGAPALTAVDGIAAVSPGGTDTFLPVDLSTSATRTISGGSGAIGERFSLRPDLNDMIEVMGARQPSSADSPRVFRQAFLFVVGRGRTAAPAAIAKIDRIRRAWEPFFARAVDNRGRVETRLSSGT